jgi:hypothetical protein
MNPEVSSHPVHVSQHSHRSSRNSHDRTQRILRQDAAPGMTPPVLHSRLFIDIPPVLRIFAILRMPLFLRACAGHFTQAFGIQSACSDPPRSGVGGGPAA